ncbi:Mor transcription activator family protein [Maridesulfovibrio hydrothermalis]|uniref:Mor transcription activator domain-containing protein n=1 Tax=Maridesulfovibrio hydrothermalis AM13 = DSM 14728 TaxID=1121451 RepID=L0RA95_9BACT|nr:helix-turn-helix domain-containing protein [Maridesulfovibrio hydrothermalis]CCO23679.1 conserved protein of unknown function [Maridesulfovibrio hydrothermalis AM13 = DSM 14728]
MILGFFTSCGDFPDLDGKRAMSPEELIKILGDEAAERVMYYWGGTRVSVPDMDDLRKVRLRERIRQAFIQGATPAQVAERFGVSVRTAQRMRVPANYVERETKMI